MQPTQAPAGRRRTWVKKRGKKLLRGVLRDYLAGQSRISNDPVLPRDLFPWADELRAAFPKIRAELDAQLADRARLPRFQDVSPDQYRISPDNRWHTMVFYGFGRRTELPCELCPETARALGRVPDLQTAFFSILSPGKHVPRHRGVTKGLVRCHMGLKIPRDADSCVMEVGGVRCTWAEGELLFFDDTYPHEVWNETDEDRAVLLFDFHRPMSWRGRWVSRLTLFLLRRTAYFRDALRNQRAWEESYRRQQGQPAA